MSVYYLLYQICLGNAEYFHQAAACLTGYLFFFFVRFCLSLMLNFEHCKD